MWGGVEDEVVKCGWCIKVVNVVGCDGCEGREI